MKALSNRPACVNNATLSWGDSRGPTKHKQKNKVHFQLKISSYQRPVEKSRRTTAPEEIFSENLKSYKGGGGGWATVYLCGKVVCRAWSFH